jgi:hypothetical protein
MRKLTSPQVQQNGKDGKRFRIEFRRFEIKVNFQEY